MGLSCTKQNDTQQETAETAEITDIQVHIGTPPSECNTHVARTCRPRSYSYSIDSPLLQFKRRISQ